MRARCCTHYQSPALALDIDSAVIRVCFTPLCSNCSSQATGATGNGGGNMLQNILGSMSALVERHPRFASPLLRAYQCRNTATSEFDSHLPFYPQRSNRMFRANDGCGTMLNNILGSMAALVERHPRFASPLLRAYQSALLALAARCASGRMLPSALQDRAAHFLFAYESVSGLIYSYTSGVSTRFYCTKFVHSRGTSSTQ